MWGSSPLAYWHTETTVTQKRGTLKRGTCKTICKCLANIKVIKSQQVWRKEATPLCWVSLAGSWLCGQGPAAVRMHPNFRKGLGTASGSVPVVKHKMRHSSNCLKKAQLQAQLPPTFSLLAPMMTASTATKTICIKKVGGVARNLKDKLGGQAWDSEWFWKDGKGLKLKEA